MCRRYCLLLVLWAIAPVPAQNTGGITGKILDVGGKPIQEIQVMLVGTDFADVTDSTGTFFIENIRPGTYTLLLRHIAFEHKRIRSVRIDSGHRLDLGIMKVRERILLMEGVIVSATRTSHLIDEVSRSVNWVPEARISERNPRSTAEALREETGIFIQKTEHGGGSAILRGMGSNQILILVDGIRLNNATYRLGNHPYLTWVDPFTLDQIEVVRGPASVLYGSDALGGTINLVTRRLDDAENGMHIRLAGRVASADREKTSRLDFTMNRGKFAFITGITYQDFGDLRRGTNSSHPELEKSVNDAVQNPTAFSAFYVDSKVLFRLTPSRTLTFAYQKGSRDHVPRYDKYENDGYFRWIYHPQNRDLVYLSYGNRLQSKWLSSVKATLSYHRQKEGRENQKTSLSPLTEDLTDVSTGGFNVQADALLGKHLVTAGADVYMDYVKCSRLETDPVSGLTEKVPESLYPDGSRYNSSGFYLQDEYRLFPWWTLICGARFSAFEAVFSAPAPSPAAASFEKITQHFRSLTASLNMIFRLGGGFSFNTNMGQAFRAPNLSDITKLGESKGNIYEVPNFSLRPETILGLDAGILWHNSRIKGSVSLFSSEVTDLLASAESTYLGQNTIIVHGEPFKVKSKQNTGNARIRGVESSLDLFFTEHIVLMAGITAIRGDNLTLNEPVGSIPPVFGRAGLRGEWDRVLLDFYVRFASKQDKLSSDDLDDPRIPPGGTPGWVTVNIRGSFSFYPGISLRLGLENMMDINYREHGSGVNGAGRNWIAGLEIQR